jgi:arylsulfatase A-like enzyme
LKPNHHDVLVERIAVMPHRLATSQEHGGTSKDDVHVGLLVWQAGLAAANVQDNVTTTQVAPTVVKLLGLDPTLLDGVNAEGTPVLPGLDL